MVARVLPVTTGAAIIEKKLSAQNVVRLERLSRPAVRARGDRSACSGAAVHEVAKLRATPGDRREAQAETVLRLAGPAGLHRAGRNAGPNPRRRRGTDGIA